MRRRAAGHRAADPQPLPVAPLDRHVAPAPVRTGVRTAGRSAACGTRRCGGRRGRAARARRRTPGGPSSSSFTRSSRASSLASTPSSNAATPRRPCGPAPRRAGSRRSRGCARAARGPRRCRPAPGPTSSSARATTARSWPGSSSSDLAQRRLVAGLEQRGELVLLVGGQQRLDELAHDRARAGRR